MKRILSLLCITALMLQMILVVPGVSASGTADIVVSTVEAAAGQTDVQVAVDLNSMGGSADIASLRLEVSYPAELTLTNVVRGDALPSLTITKVNAPYTSPLGIYWSGADGDTTTGTLVILTFSVSKTAAKGLKPVEVSLGARDAVNGDLEILTLTTESGGIDVQEPLKDFDANAFTFEGKAVEYDGNTHSLTVVPNGTVPSGVTYSYSTTGAKNAGTYNVTATISAPGYNDLQKTAVLTINKKPVTITIDSAEISVGDAIPALSYKVSGLVGSDKVSGTPAVSANGAAGTYPITRGTLQVIDGTTGKASPNYTVNFVEGTLTINEVYATGITLNKTSAVVEEGNTLQLTAAFTPANTTNQSLTWSSNNNAVAKVSATGLVTALSEGTATITATAANGKTASCVITVPHEHILKYVARKEATCIEKGNIEHWMCTSCGKMYSDENAANEVSSVEIAKDTNNHVGGIKYVGAVEPTTSSEGHTGIADCASCGNKVGDGEVIPKLPHAHKMTEHPAVDATCISAGTAAYWTCSDPACSGVMYADAAGGVKLTSIVTPVDPANHTGTTEVRDDKAATCTEKGYTGDTVYTCCDAVKAYGTSISATGHDDSGEWQYDAENHYKVCKTCNVKISNAAHSGGTATCQVKALCSACGTEYGKLAAHNLTKTEAKAATCTEAGNIAYHECSVCRNKYADTDAETLLTVVSVAATGHSWSAWDVGETEATRKCKNCDATDSRKIEAEITVPVSSDAEDNTETSDVSITTLKDETTNQVDILITEKALLDAVDTQTETEADEFTLKIDVAAVAENNDSIESVEQVTLPAAAIAAIDEKMTESESAIGLEIAMTSGTVTFDSTALQKITEQTTSTESEKVDISLEMNAAVLDENTTSDHLAESITSGMTDEQLAELNSIHTDETNEIVAVVDVNLVNVATGNAIGSADAQFGKDAVTISIPFEGEENAEYSVLYIADDGETEVIDAEYDSEAGCLTFKVSHFSKYVAVQNVESADEPTYTVTAVGKGDNIPSYTVAGQTLTVTYSLACKVGYMVDGTYVTLAATANADGSYSYTVPEKATDVVVVVKGDVNGDGKVNTGDYGRLNAVLLGKANLDEIANFAADVNSDNKVNTGDYGRINAVLLGETTITW